MTADSICFLVMALSLSNKNIRKPVLVCLQAANRERRFPCGVSQVRSELRPSPHCQNFYACEKFHKSLAAENYGC
jgi:hypothetical protein